MLNFTLFYLILKQLVFDLIRFVISTFRHILWQFNGNYRNLDRFVTSAQVEQILWKSKKNLFESLHPRHFIGYHLRFDSPNIVLHDNVSLIYVNEKEAYFLELKKSIHHYGADKVVFCWITLFRDAVKLIKMPISSFHKVAESLGPIRVPCMIVSHPGRTGSTLLCKLIQLSSKRILSLSEPDPLAHLSDMEPNKKIFGTEWDRVIKSTLRVLFKPVANVDAIVIKDRCRTIRLKKYVKEIYPEIKHMFIQRSNHVKTVQSYQRSFEDVFRWRFMYFLAKKGVLEYLIPSNLFPYGPEAVEVFKLGFKMLNMKNQFDFSLVLWADYYKAFMDMSKFVPFDVLDYEDLLANPEKEIRNIFKTLNVEPETLKKALDIGLKSDSQKDTPLAKDITRSRHYVDYSGGIKERGDKFLDVLGLPRI